MSFDYILWHDNDFDLAYWVKNNSVLKDFSVQFHAIPKTNNPSQILDSFSDECTKSVMPYIKFETPDLIIQKISEEEGNPVICVTELMTHTPQWQHPAQRFARLYNSCILKTPTALILPNRKIKWEKSKSSKNYGEYKEVVYRCSPSVYQLFVDPTSKSQTPALIFNWPDNNGYLLYDEHHQTSPYISGDILKWFEFVNQCVLTNGNPPLNSYDEVLRKMQSKAEIKYAEKFNTIKGVFDTASVIRAYKLDADKLSEGFMSNDKTLVFEPNGLKCKSSKFRTDPYAGILCAFDMMFCRDEAFERCVNLVLIAKNVKLSEIQFSLKPHNNSECPFVNCGLKLSKEHLSTCSFTQAKYRRIYGEVADVIVFDDGIFYNTEG